MKNLKASELRIGNYLQGEPFSCQRIGYGDGVIQIMAGGILGVEQGHLNYKPIPLAEEWLVKSNCSKINVPNMYAIGRGDVCISIRFLEEGGNKICIITDDEELYLKNHVKYLHEFQNLCLDLTKEEVIFKKIS